jgi:hypothetical protein
MFKWFQELDDLDQRSFFTYLSGRLGAETFESYFKEYLNLKNDDATK